MGLGGDGEGAVVDGGEVELVEDAVDVVFFFFGLGGGNGFGGFEAVIFLGYLGLDVLETCIYDEKGFGMLPRYLSVDG